MKAEVAARYHKLVFKVIRNAHDMIGAVDHEEDNQDFFEEIQKALDEAAGVLLILRNAGALIEPALLKEFGRLNGNIVELNAEFDAGLLPRAIGDVPEYEAPSEMPPAAAAVNVTDCYAVNVNVAGGSDNDEVDCGDYEMV